MQCVNFVIFIDNVSVYQLMRRAVIHELLVSDDLLSVFHGLATVTL